MYENRGGIMNQWGKEGAFDKWFWNHCLSMQEKKIPTTPYTKINLKSIKDLNVFEKYWKKYIIKGKNFLNKTHTKKTT